MIPFHEMELTDRSWMEPLFRAEYLDCEEFSFTFCYLWRKAYHYQVARMNDYLLLIAYPQFPERTSYLFPAGTGDLKPVIEALLADASQRHIPLRFHTLTATQRAKLEALYPEQFAYTEMRDYADYIYTAESQMCIRDRNTCVPLTNNDFATLKMREHIIDSFGQNPR